jgi:hypothetical protein
MKVNTQKVVLKVYGEPIRLHLGPGAACVESKLPRETCTRCGHAGCGLSDCAHGCGGPFPEETIDRLRYNAILDAIERLVLAHALAGVDVQASGYVSGIETMLEAAGNNL